MQFQPGMSSRDMLQSIAFAKLTKDDTDEDFSKAMLTQILSDSSEAIAKTNQSMTITLVESLAKLNELGYDNDSDLVKDLIANNKAISATMVKLSDASSKIMNR